MNKFKHHKHCQKLLLKMYMLVWYMTPPISISSQLEIAISVWMVREHNTERSAGSARHYCQLCCSSQPTFSCQVAAMGDEDDDHYYNNPAVRDVVVVNLSGPFYMLILDILR